MTLFIITWSQVTAGAPLKKEYTEEVRGIVINFKEIFFFKKQNNMVYRESEVVLALTGQCACSGLITACSNAGIQWTSLTGIANK